MRLGFALPQLGPAAGPDALVAVAQRAEALGYDDLWVLDRVLWPIAPRAPYPAMPDGHLPDGYKRVLDPFETLTFVAAHTSRIGLGTSVLNAPYYNPVLLARQLTSIDVLSKGRLRVGFGTGWSPDEYEAVGVPINERGKRANELVQALKAIWTTDPVSFEGQYFRIAKSHIALKPVQKPHPPVYFAAYTPAAMRRVARIADGWMPAGIPVEGMRQMFASIRQMAAEAGRDPGAVTMIVRANVMFAGKPLAADRGIFTGTPEQIQADIVATRKLGAAGLLFDVQFSPGIATTNAYIDKLEQLLTLAQA
jgi:probable F420-dependent oxidoreductase